MGFLCKEQVIKGLYLAIGSRHRLPKDLLLIIYRLTKDDSAVRQYHTDEIYRNTIPNYSSTSLFATGTGSALYTTSTEFPLGRGLEWAIKWEKDKIKKVRHTQIQVFGDRDYLLKRTKDPRDASKNLVTWFGQGSAEPWDIYHFSRSHNKLKLLYLNNSPADEVLDDYLNYLESDRDSGHRLYIDDFGDAVDCIGDAGDEIFIDS